jgi:hypothetical protein
LIVDVEKEIKKKYNSKLVIITDDFFLEDLQNAKEEKDRLYPQMIEAIKKVIDSIIINFSKVNLQKLVNHDCRKFLINLI